MHSANSLNSADSLLSTSLSSLSLLLEREEEWNDELGASFVGALLVGTTKFDGGEEKAATVKAVFCGLKGVEASAAAPSSRAERRFVMFMVA